MRKRHSTLIVLLVSLGLALPAAAAVAPDGSEFLVHRTRDSWQETPVAAFGPGGVSVVAWTDTRHGIKAQLYGPEGAARGPVLDLVQNQVPAVPGAGPARLALEPAVVFAADGALVLAWAEERGHLRVEPFFQDFELEGRRVMVQRFRMNGDPAGQALALSEATDRLESWPKLHALANGRFLAAWRSDGPDGADADGLYARHLGGVARPRGAEVRLSDEVDGEADYASFSEASEGRVLVTWEGCCDAGGDLGIFSRLYDAEGQSFGPLRQINVETSRRQRRPWAAVAGDQGFLVVWQGILSRTEGHVFGRFVGLDGEPGGAQFQVSLGHGPVQVAPAIAAKPDGGFLAIWRDWMGVRFGVSGVELDAAGTPVGVPFRLSTGKTQKSGRTSLATDGAGRFLVPWEKAVGPRPGIHARRLESE